jgi:hypothetical protein
MALGQVSARMEGDIYQGLFFWKQAAALLEPSSKVIRVEFEHDAAAGVDDVLVAYSPPGVDAGGWQCTTDFYQVKYHVDQSGRYSYECLIDPKFTGTKTSLLQRFYKAYSKLRQSGGSFRLHLASNWNYTQDDPLISTIRENDGCLPKELFTSRAKSKLGKIRLALRDHLEISDSDLKEFCKVLRIKLNYMGRRDFQELVRKSLVLAGLKQVNAESRIEPLEALYVRFLTDKTASFTSQSLRELLQSEGLLENDKDISRVNRMRTLGIRSFVRFAENIENETDEHVCVASSFDGRHIRDSGDWNGRVRKTISEYFANPDRQSLLRQCDHLILLDCHQSIAYLVGSELDLKSGAKLTIRQKGELGSDWRVTGIRESGWDIKKDMVELKNDTTSLVVAISVTCDVRSDVQAFISETFLNESSVLHFEPSVSTGTLSISGPDHAYWFAERVARDIFAWRKLHRNATLHLFVAAPNAFMFYLGQHHRELGTVQLYEYNYDLSGGASYATSLLI